MQTTPITVRPREAARMLGISQRTLLRWTAAGIVRAVRIGGVTLARLAGRQGVGQ